MTAIVKELLLGEVENIILIIFLIQPLQEFGRRIKNTSMMTTTAFMNI